MVGLWCAARWILGKRTRAGRNELLSTLGKPGEYLVWAMYAGFQGARERDRGEFGARSE